ncbi:MAG: Epimerase family protein [Chlamydiia bacterium]|nr:Epimerase family protein [Chlamydiia bacterium]MCH9615465.1 Epimerase family protein [Chlamydiia bacterium]MCH9629120.1 Epimerase family protein [Chlamydiia bacterium]
MKIAIAGSSGLVGSHLIRFLKEAGHEITPLVRNAYETGPFDAVINLAGESIGTGLWTKSKKQRILNSRIETTKKLVETVDTKLFLSANAVGYYGDQGDEPLDENTPKGTGFLSDVCANWEREALKSSARTLIMRFGIVLSPKGGALSKLKLPFKMGPGTQYISWIHIEDLCRAIAFLLTSNLEGVFNLTAPEPLTQEQFSRTFHKYCFPFPSWLIKLLMGEMGDEMVLSSTKALPTKLCDHNFTFNYPQLKDCPF